MTDDPAVGACAAFLAPEEAFRARPYLDLGGVSTIGYGQTYLADGSRVTMQTPPISQADAMFYLRKLLSETYLPAVRRAVIHPLTINQAAALGSLCYNIGPGAFRASSLVYCINNGKTAEIEGQFLVWDKVRDPNTHELVVSAGLLERRSREFALYATPDGGEPLAPSQAPAIATSVIPVQAADPGSTADDLDDRYNPGL